MLKNFVLCLLLSAAASAMQQSCNAKADDCKDPVADARHYPEQHCTCFTCEKGTPNEKKLCTNDDQETQKLQARLSDLGNYPKPKTLEQKEVVAAKGKAVTIVGWVKDVDGKTVFESDKDKQTWEISNADAVKGHEGHHVRVKAKLDEANQSLTIEKMSMMRKEHQTGEMQKKGEPK